MSTLNTCPFCSYSLLHHFGNHREYWFCRHCWLEMPNIENQDSQYQQQLNVVNLSTSLSKLKKLAMAN